MKKVLAALALSGMVSINVYASKIESEEKSVQNDFYIALKALATLGNSIKEETTTLEGDMGKGVGVDLGYELTHGFSIEVDATYVENSVKETLANGDSEEFSASYITTSLDIDYKYHLTHEAALIAKVGYEYEIEKIKGLDINNNETGYIVAAAVEYEISEHMALLGEYEYTSIVGPRGNGIFAGIVYGF
ncbi:outer membrane beta-barrel protein [Sulfurimonas aquatica]|uniref:Outer membrane beta-barrel protein n=1 Tax=Sulfurimonas aquatica TaxID=2672570 RepID=A0A975GDU6_9BACT|nr:porin family protein [Sulfurimonas aquatica]QSZ42684.1 outer membrane beta-barrel protein [Sulfurimonas aquatica]